MKANKAQITVEFVILMALGLVIFVTGLSNYSGQLSYFFKKNSEIATKSTYTATRVMKYENPKDMVSNINIVIEGTTVFSPVELVISSNLQTGFYDQTSNASVRLKEIADIMLNANAGSQLTSFAGGLSGSLSAFLASVPAINTSDPDIQIKLKIIKMAVLLDPANTNNKWSNLNSALPGAIGCLTPPSKKSFVKVVTEDLLSIPDKIQFSIEPGVYKDILGVAYNNTLTQDLLLVNTLLGKPLAVQQTYNAKIAVSPVYSYSQFTPQSYNNFRLCEMVGGTISGNDCTGL